MDLAPWITLCIITACLTCAHLARSEVRQSRWAERGQQQRQVSSSQVAVVTRGKLECVAQCARHSHCSLVAFDPAHNRCYLLPSLTPSDSTGNDLVIFPRTDAICLMEDAPTVTHGAVTWRRTLTSVQGDVICDSDYIGSTDDVMMSCSSDNAWTVTGQCLRHYWTPPVYVKTGYAIPRAVGTGWKMCVNATPRNANQLTVTFYDVSKDRPLKINFRFYEDGSPACRTTFFSYINGAYHNTAHVSSPAFPLKESVSFSLKVRASSDFAVDTYVNGVFYYSYTLAVSVSTIVSVRFTGEWDIQDMDLWCS